MLQKEFTVDFLTKKKKVNEGEVAQYYIENSHEAIINPIEWDAVQVEIARRKALGRQYSGQSVFATKIICGDCGAFFGRKVWHSNSPNRKFIWRCNEKFNGEKICNTPFVTEEDIKSQFVDVYNGLIKNKEIVLDTCRLVQDTLTDCAKLDSEILELQNEMEVVAELTKKAINDNAVKALNQDEFIKKYESFDNRFTKAQTKYEKLKAERQSRNDKADAIGAFMFKLSEFDEVITEFDEWLWIISVDKVIVQPDGTLKFIFKYNDDSAE